MERQKAQKVLIRLARSEDSNDIVRLQLNSLKNLSAQDYSPRQLQALLDSKRCPRSWDETIFIAEIDRQIVGFASLLKSHNIIGAVFVDPHFVRRGVGTKLLQFIEAKAINKNIKVLWVCSSLTGHAFYKANGYQTISKIKLYRNLATPIPCIRMKKRLLTRSKDTLPLLVLISLRQILPQSCSASQSRVTWTLNQQEQTVDLVYKLFVFSVTFFLFISVFF